jgi:hypothetical protein
LRSTRGINRQAINTSSGLILCARRLPEDGTLAFKHVGVIYIKNCVSLYVFYCILLSAIFGQYIEDTKTRRVSNIKFAGYGQSDYELRKCVLDEVKRKSVIKRTQTCRQAGKSLQECRVTVYRLRKYIVVGWKLTR